MAIPEQNLHFVLLPFMAQGHMIPMVDLARLLAKRGLIITILTTPHNKNRFKTLIDRAISSGLKINIFSLKFPNSESGLPEGCENVDLLPSVNDAPKFFTATSLLKEQVEKLLQELNPIPNCLIADMCFPWATNVAKKLHIPRIVFHGTSCFSLLCMHIVAKSNNFEHISSDTEYFVMPGLPDRIEITKAQLRGTLDKTSPEWTKLWNEIREAEDQAFGTVANTFEELETQLRGTLDKTSPEWTKLWNEIREAEDQAFGTVANTFEELESEYVKEYIRTKGKKVWCIGPVSLCNKDSLDKAERGNKSAIDEHECLKWLDTKDPSSVLYVCLGSLSRLATSQLIEIGLALEASNRPFIWVIRDATEELETWLEKFKDRINNRGLLISGWAPQVMILSHLSIGGFLTHCGWNSTIEGITAGVPMMTWPVLGEQFYNEKFIVNVIKTGVRAGVEVPIFFGDEERVGVLVKKEEVERVIEELMNGGKEGEERRKRAKKLGEVAKMAVEEEGSSYRNLTLFIEDVVMKKC
ncbi:UDP-glucuronosyl and UDP-glucosyl transferase [Handroanthus impetiginosus]|uniref:Glycosyltransferase n=1 Tax=Handroanthus impetiginosus TaxID=429701 RepID=A0A2G9HB34_9LAMI|nr:UDP-glucuronosyl and UDP-glucosyl transferase [Handroanthus impetiginosus]